MDREQSGASRNTLTIGIGAILVVLAGIGGWAAAQMWSDPASGLASGERRAIETVVRDYILENPEIIPQAMENLQRKENEEALASVQDDVMNPYPGAVLGNPEGSITLVEFSDFACGYCRSSVEDVKALLAKRPELKIVVRELPILSEESAAAARMALAAAEQGRYEAFYNAMFATGRPSATTIEQAAKQAGVDLAKARTAIDSGRFDAEIEKNLDIARQLGFNGTPSWIVGGRLIAGAVGADALADAIEESQS